MQNAEFKLKCQATGTTYADLAEATGVSERTARRWAIADEPPAAAVDYLTAVWDNMIKKANHRIAVADRSYCALVPFANTEEQAQKVGMTLGQQNALAQFIAASLAAEGIRIEIVPIISSRAEACQFPLRDQEVNPNVLAKCEQALKIRGGELNPNHQELAHWATAWRGGHGVDAVITSADGLVFGELKMVRSRETSTYHVTPKTAEAYHLNTTVADFAISRMERLTGEKLSRIHYKSLVRPCQEEPETA